MVRSLTTQLLRLAAPVAVGRLGVVAMGVVDTIVVGNLAGAELAHLGLGWTLNGPALYGAIGLLLGVQVLGARALGAGRADLAVSIWQRGLVVSAVAGGLIFLVLALLRAPLLTSFGISRELVGPATNIGLVLALSIPLHLGFIASTNFLEAMQRPTPGAVAMWMGNGVNLVLNLVLVSEWGAIGSACSTVLSRLFLFTALVGYILWTGLSKVEKRQRAEGAVSAGYGALLTIGGPAALSAVVEAGAFAALSIIAARAGNTAVATFQISTGGLVTLVFMIALGFSTAGTVLVSRALGRSEQGEAMRAGWLAIGLATLGMVIAGLLCVVFSAEVARGFTADAATVSSLIVVMPLVAALMIPDGGQGVADSILRAYGDNWFPTAMRLIAFALIAPPLALWLSEQQHLGIGGILGALTLASFGAYVGLLVRLWIRTGSHARPRNETQLLAGKSSD